MLYIDVESAPTMRIVPKGEENFIYLFIYCIVMDWTAVHSKCSMKTATWSLAFHCCCKYLPAAAGNVFCIRFTVDAALKNLFRIEIECATSLNLHCQ